MRVLRAGFYAHFSPVSYSANREPGSAGFDMHRGYEADLLTALEAMDGAGISFERRGIAEWDGIWRTGEIDALVRGVVGNRYAADASGGDFTVTALDSAIELGGFTLSADEQELADCIGAKIDWLTDEGRIGYSDWIDAPKVFLDRARLWRPGSAE